MEEKDNYIRFLELKIEWLQRDLILEMEKTERLKKILGEQKNPKDKSSIVVNKV